MKNFQIINAQGNNINEAILAFSAALNKIRMDPRFELYEFSSMLITQTYEAVEQPKILSMGPQQMRLIVNCTGYLEDQAPAITEKEKKDLTEAARFKCDHSRLDQNYHYHNDAGGFPAQWKYCFDCGAEVYQGVPQDKIIAAGKMKVVPGDHLNIDPEGEAQDKRQDEIDKVFGPVIDELENKFGLSAAVIKHQDASDDRDEFYKREQEAGDYPDTHDQFSGAGGRRASCQACNNRKHFVVTRVYVPHTCGK